MLPDAADCIFVKLIFSGKNPGSLTPMRNSRTGLDLSDKVAVRHADIGSCLVGVHDFRPGLDALPVLLNSGFYFFGMPGI